MAKEKKTLQSLIAEAEANTDYWGRAFSERYEDSDLAKYIRDEITPEEYIQAMSGRIKNVDPHNGSHTWEMAWNNSHQNTEANNSRAFENLVEFERKQDTSLENGYPAESAIKNIVQKPLSSRIVNELLFEDKYEFNNDLNREVTEQLLEGSESIQQEHYFKMLEEKPELLGNALGGLKYKSTQYIKQVMDKNLFGKILEHPNAVERLPRYDFLFSSHINPYISEDEESGDNINDTPPHLYQALLENNKKTDSLNWSTVSDLMGRVSEEYRNNYISDQLGIIGGQLTDPNKDNLEENWDNWTPGPNYNSDEASSILKEWKIPDEIAEHIKRHGSFKEKYRLFHNDKVDPKHGKEMYWKWHRDESEHGYDAEELIEKYKRDKKDKYTLDDLGDYDEEELHDSAREGAEGDFSFRDWVNQSLTEDDTLGMDIYDFPDDFEDDVINKVTDSYDWEAPNPDFDQEKEDAYQKVMDYAEKNDLDEVPADKVNELTGMELKDLELQGLADINNMIDMDEMIEQAEEYNPENIDFSESVEHSITDHPEWNERYAKELGFQKLKYIEDNPYDFYDDFYSVYKESPDYEEVYQKHLIYAARDNNFFDEHWESAHQDARFVPEHVATQIPELAEITKERKKLTGEGPHRTFLNSQVKDRDYEYSYGDNLHHHEILKDYADYNNGKIDAGTMNKKFPNLKDIWKDIFKGQGKLTSEEVQAKIDELPKTKYGISYGAWTAGKMQNLNDRDQLVIRLDHSEESLEPLKSDPKLYETFKKIQQVSKQSGHPTNNDTIAWARVDASDPKHWMIDEVQSDFGKSVTRYLKDSGESEKANHVKAISDHHKNWREALLNHVIKLAKKHGAEKISTHSPESKSQHTGSDNIHSVYKDSYKKVPRKMGFQATSYETLPLSDRAKDYFDTKASRIKNLIDRHGSAFGRHTRMAQLYENALKDPAGVWQDHIEKFSEIPSAKLANTKQDFINQHKALAEKHAERAGIYGEFDYSKYIDSDDEFYSYETEVAADQLVNHLSDPEKHSVSDVYDTDLDKEPIDFSKEKSHEGHTFNLTPQLFNNKLKKYFGLTLDLLKGGPARRWPYNPQKEMPKETIQATKELVHNYEYDMGSLKFPNKNAKNRALQKLHNKTEARRNPQTGEREFLLHRAHSTERDRAGSFPFNYDHSSWTYDRGIARDMSKDWHQDSDVVRDNLISAWIPDSKISYMVDMARPNINSNEGEVIVHNPKKSLHLDPKQSPFEVAGSIYDKEKTGIWGESKKPIDWKPVKKSQNWKNKYKHFLKAEPDFKQPIKRDFNRPKIDPSGDMVHGEEHGFRGSIHSPSQTDLIHGIDMESGEDLPGKENLNTIDSKVHHNVLSNKKTIVKPATGITRGDKEKQAILGHLDSRGHNAARREVMFHNMANNFFGLKNVPTTAGFTKKGQDYSAQEIVNGLSIQPSNYANNDDFNQTKQKYHNTLKNMNNSGNLHKLAMMDYIMGNHDRHRGNFLLGEDNLHLIDNGLAFDYDNLVRTAPVPRYLTDAEGHGISNKVHPESVKWLQNLSDEQAMKMWGDHGYEPEHPTVRGFLERLHNIKQYVNQHHKDRKLSDILGLSRKTKGRLEPKVKPTISSDEQTKTADLPKK